MNNTGKKMWIIPDMYWPEVTSDGYYVSHESVCVLNTTDEDANIEITLYYEDAEPIRGLKAECKSNRTHHIRMDKMLDKQGKHIPRGVAYAAVINSDIDIVVQYTRVDTTQSENALMTTMAF